MTRPWIPLLALLAVACSSGNDVTVGDYVIQPYQNTPPEQSLPGQVFEDVTLRVLNHNGDPQGDLAISFTGDGTIEPASGITGADGTVSVRWALPETLIQGVSTMRTGPPGEYQLTAAVGAESLVLHTSAHAFKADKVDAGFNHACGIVSQVLWCWGNELETWTTLPPAAYSTPVEFASLGAITDVAVSSYSVCVLNTSGAPLCSAAATGKVFAAVSGAPELLDLSDGDAFFCGRARDLTAWCWYVRGDTPMQAAQVSSSLHFTSIGTGGNQNVSGNRGFGCGLTATGEAWCWGRNDHGQLGDGTNVDSPVPVPVSGEHVFTQIEVTYSAACGVAEANTILCWGVNGPLLAESNVPVPVSYSGGSGPLLALGMFEAYVATPAGKRMWSFGDVDDIGLDGLGLSHISADGQLCALNPDNEVYCSWILVYGGGDSFVTPGGVVAVPRPGMTFQVPALQADAPHRAAISLGTR